MPDSSMDLIRRANPIPSELAPPPIEEVWRRIEAGYVPDLRERRALVRPVREAGRESSSAARSVRRSRLTIGGLAITATSLLVIGIAIGALALLGGHRRAPSQSGSVEFATREQLLQTLGVLRARPDAAARRAISCAESPPAQRSSAFSACLSSAVPSSFLVGPSQSLHSTPLSRQRARQVAAREGYPRPDSRLLRVVPIPQYDATITIAPTTWQPFRTSRRRSEGLVAAINQPGQQSAIGPRPISLNTVIKHGLAISDAQGQPTQTVVLGAVIVPDGVAKVTLEPIRIVAPPAPINPDQLRNLSVTTEVHDNVAPFRFPVLTATNPKKPSALYGVTVIARATWFDRRGSVIDHTTTQLYLSINLHGQGVSSGTIP
jgi:hypothetical protein